MSWLISRPKLDFNPLPYPPLPRTQALTSTTFKPPPLDGSLSIPELYDWHYENTPDHPVLVFPEVDGTLRELKWREVSEAYHRGARLLRRITGFDGSVGNDRVVGIFAAPDTITYFTLIASSFRAGLVPFIISPRNSPAALAHLLSKTSTRYVLVGHESALQETFQATLHLLREADPASELPAYSYVPEFGDFYRSDGEPFEPLPPYKPDMTSLGILLHSSGSTAFPKPIAYSHLQLFHLGVVPYFGDRDLTGVRLCCHAMPMYHGMGMMQTMWTATMGITISAARPQRPPIPPTPENVLESSRATNSDIMFCVPSFLESWSNNPDSIAYLSSIGGALYGGGPMNKSAGDRLTRHGVSIFVLYGCAEVGIMSPILPRTSGLDWEYFTFSKQIKTAFVPNGEGQFEFVVQPNPYEIPTVINGTLDGEDAYYTSDLLAAHPTKPGYYKVFGRADDQIMHNTGEKTNPGPLETILNQDPRVQSSVMFGRGRFNVGVIIDPVATYRIDPTNSAEVAEFRNAIWPTVERMNAYAPQHSRLFKEMILLASPNKPFGYTAKSTPRRQTIIANYEPEIDALYLSVAETTQSDVTPPSVWDAEQTRQFVQKIIFKVMGTDELGDDDDIFQRGCDSLQATWIRNTLLRAVRDSTRANTNTVPENLVYQYPSVSQLSAFTVRLASQGTDVVWHEGYEQLVFQNMEDMVAKYSEAFPERIGSAHLSAQEGPGDVYLVTGTTGSLGASLLYDLLQNERVAKVYAVNRPGRSTSSITERQEKAFRTIGVDPKLLSASSSQLVLVEADLADVNAGFPTSLSEEIRSSVTHIVLNAWPVDFNLSLQSFETSVKAVRNMIDLALSSYRANPAKIFFVSSVGVLSRRQGKSAGLEVPATPHEAAVNGYSQSKWVAESILRKATAATTLQAAVVRVGQIAGGINGYWKQSDWLPTIVKSSQALESFPSFESDQVVSWVPLHFASRALFELSEAPLESTPTFHLVHPNPVPATFVSTAIASKLNLPLTPYSEWLDRLEANTSKDLKAIPALRMPKYFQAVKAGLSLENKEAWGLPNLDAAEACKASSFMNEMERIKESDIDKWIQGWVDSGLL